MEWPAIGSWPITGAFTLAINVLIAKYSKKNSILHEVFMRELLIKYPDLLSYSGWN